MKVFAVVASLVASFADVEARVRGPQVAARVRVVGPDPYCESVDSKVGCDADYSLVVDKFQDGTVKGILHDKSLNPNNPEENGSLGVRAAIDCLNIFVDEEDDNATIAIATGNITWGEDVGKYGVYTAAKKYPNRTGYNTGSGRLTIKQPLTNCTDDGLINFIKNYIPFREHKKGKVIIEVL
jgi:hypothetical protein